MAYGKIGVLRTFGLAFAGLVAVGGIGCGGASNTPPELDVASLIADCTLDGSSYVWDFVAFVDDAEGYADVTSVYVDVFDVATETVVESHPLTHNGNGEWSAVVVEGTDSQYLDCANKSAFEFDFYATDTGGESSSYTLLP